MAGGGWLTFLSDFGFEDAFLGVCKGVIARTAPEVQVIDLLHLVIPQDVDQGAAVLAAALPYLPSPAVHLALVDPFRAEPLRAVAVRAQGGSTFVAPDNGLASLAWAAAGGAVQAHVLDNDALWLPVPARTFRARDVFAPVAARLAAGLPLEEVGSQVDVEGLCRLQARPPAVDDDHVHAEVAMVDHFGNLTLNLRRSDLEAAGIQIGDSVDLRCGGTSWTVPFTLHYGEVLPGRVAVCEDAFRTITVAVNQGNASRLLSARRGDPLVLARVPQAEPPRPGLRGVYDQPPSRITA